MRVVIVGGGIIGGFAAWSLRREGFAGEIVVVEQDPTYQRSSTALSAASIRTQFGTPTNVAMSLHGADTFRRIRTLFGEDADIAYRERGYLILGRADQRDEGRFDAWSLLALVRRAARGSGVEYVHAAVESLAIDGAAVRAVTLRDGTRLDCDVCVLAAGAWSGRLAARVGIDLPVVPKKRTVFAFDAPFDLPNFPMLFGTSGLWVRPEGTGFIGGIQPAPRDDADADEDFEPQHGLFEDPFWPLLAERIPAMERLRLRRAWAGHYEVNTLDHNGVVGPHDEVGNLVFATGFSGHGVQHAPAVGRGVAEWIVHGGWRTIDLGSLGYGRIRTGTPMVESIVY